MYERVAMSFLKKIAFFSSMRFAIALLIVIIFMSTISTFYSQSLFSLKTPLFALPYYSAFLMLFISLILCSIKKIKQVIKTQTIKEENLKPIISLNGDEKIKKIFKPPFYSFGNEAKYIVIKRFAFQAYSTVITHIAFAFIIFGAFLSSFGYEGFIVLKLHRPSNTLLTKTGEVVKTLPYYITLNTSIIEPYPQKELPEEYKTMNITKRYLAFLSLSNNNKQEKIKISLNHPASFLNTKIYLYGFTRGSKLINATIHKKNGETKILGLNEKPETRDNTYPVITDLYLDFALLSDYTPTNVSEDPIRPVLRIGIFENSKEKTAFYYAVDEDKYYPTKENDTTLKEIDGVYRIDSVRFNNRVMLLIRHDMGVYIVYLSSIMLLIGLFLTFFVSQAKYYIKDNTVFISKSDERSIYHASIFLKKIRTPYDI